MRLNQAGVLRPAPGERWDERVKEADSLVYFPLTQPSSARSLSDLKQLDSITR